MSCVLFTEHTTRDGQIIGEIRLNAEKSLNALTLEMIDLIQPKLDAWRDDPNVVAVLLDSSGDKAFCAGGDIVNLYKSMVEGDTEFPDQFFSREYRLDYALHTYPKPVICWASGIVMGGGMGLMNGCSHRVVTETTHLAMPEVTIGLYPDVGGSWFLNRMQCGTGLFLGLTGNPINAADALHLGLADRALTTDMRDGMLERLRDEEWGEDAGGVVSRVLRELEEECRATFADMPAPIRAHEDLIREVTDHDSVEEMVEALLAVESDDKWVKRAQKAIGHGSPLSIKLIHEQLRRCRHLSLREVFQQELIVSVQCCRHRELQEGVRALLIDKDGQPNWTFDSVEEVDPDFLNGLFEAPWPKHPLADL
ncbi:enoyl-CoA hydratase/isomerase family protein [Marinobacterium weihaiense]|uniref:Enoyl-CoA hydratase/isomerase family protein n=1 Tax=Marinobacterium weihaiense TaxID=2851016 RepID=A0ABS6MDL3_9GAMM|nr:enoyl-CoA hydratase/isomerase family protein [Marinobacterium weihaiense]MBV0934392.1 enoyl-CoA hydratase/isomerase family protein [Marinobacterium weihaiense]